MSGNIAGVVFVTSAACAFVAYTIMRRVKSTVPLLVSDACCRPYLWGSAIFRRALVEKLRQEHIVWAMLHTADTLDGVIKFGVLFMMLGVSLFCIIALRGACNLECLVFADGACHFACSSDGFCVTTLDVCDKLPWCNVECDEQPGKCSNIYNGVQGQFWHLVASQIATQILRALFGVGSLKRIRNSLLDGKMAAITCWMVVEIVVMAACTIFGLYCILVGLPTLSCIGYVRGSSVAVQFTVSTFLYVLITQPLCISWELWVWLKLPRGFVEHDGDVIEEMQTVEDLSNEDGESYTRL